ncbi:MULTISPECIES: flavodoxin [unclassified Streptomyces]|uniref:flavodoxin n=1 Tax=unclassified Streptomyces TaxID=2593676 RepID=UPI002E16E41B|nr:MULTISPECIES: flavodoxin [unclassified Streptomyces]
MADTSRRAFLGLFAAGTAGLGLAGCSLVGQGGTGARGADSGAVADSPPARGNRTLVTYFSHPYTDESVNSAEELDNSRTEVDGKVYGNVQYTATLIQRRTGGDLFRIETAGALPESHEETLDITEAQQKENARPKLKKLVKNIDDYDAVFIGYPIWWYDLPMAMYSFLEQQDLKGKKVILFSVHGGNELADTVEVITDGLTESTVVQNAFTISRDDMESVESELNPWLDALGYKS